MKWQIARSMSVATIKIDAKGRGTLRRFAKPGQVYQAESSAPGRIVLKLMTESKSGGRLEYDKAGLPVWVCGPVNVAELVRQVRDEI